MRSSIRRLFALGLLGLGFVAFGRPADAPRLPRDKLLLWRDEDGEVRPVRSVAEWGHRRAEIVRAMEAMMGPLPGPERRVPVDVKVLEEVDCGSYVRRRIMYQSEPGSRVPAFLCVPKAALAAGSERRFPGMLCPPPTDGRAGPGAAVGLGYLAYPAYGAELAERGAVTIVPAYPLLGSYAPDLRALGYVSGSMKGVWDNIRALDVLESLPYVRTGSFGGVGHSLGGHNLIFTAVFEPRLQTVVSSCGLDSFSDYYGGDPAVWAPGKAWSQERYIPRLAAYAGRLGEIPFDFAEVIAALAPRQVLLIAPMGDTNFRWRSVSWIAAAASAVYVLHGVGGYLWVEHPDCGHDFPAAMRAVAYELLLNQKK